MPRRHLCLEPAGHPAHPAHHCASEIQTAISVENRKNFPIRLYSAHPLKGSPWNWVSAPGVKKTRMMRLPGADKEIWRYIACSPCLFGYCMCTHHCITRCIESSLQSKTVFALYFFFFSGNTAEIQQRILPGPASSFNPVAPGARASIILLWAHIHHTRAANNSVSKTQDRQETDLPSVLLVRSGNRNQVMAGSSSSSWF